MNQLIKCNPSLEGAAKIIVAMHKAFLTQDESHECLARYMSGEVELWTVPGSGFIFVSIIETDKQVRVCCVEYAAGKKFYTQENIDLLDKMAAGYGCSLIECRVISSSRARLLKKVGFVVFAKYDDGISYLEREVQYGRR